MQFTSKDLRMCSTGKLSPTDQMCIEFGGQMSPEGRQFMGDCMSLEIGGSLSPDARTLRNNEMSRKFGGPSPIRPLSSDSIYTESD